MKKEITDDGWSIEVFFDGECPLCRREIDMLRRRDRNSKIRFTDISTPDFVDSEYGVSYDQLMSEIHGRLPDGTWLKGVEVFRRLYSAVGFGPIVRLTRLPIISHGLNFAYRRFAKNRLRLTGRCDSQNEACPLQK